MQKRRDKVREMMRHAWNGYKKFAWGANELSPLSQRAFHGGVFGQNDIGLTIIDALDTLYIMDMTAEYEEGKTWIEQNFTLDNYVGTLDAFETNIRIVGGLLSIFALTGDTIYREKAKYVADKLLPVFDTPTGIPKVLINLQTNETKNHEWSYGDSSILSQSGSFHLEFDYLSEITGDATYRKKIHRVRNFFKDSRKVFDLFPIYINAENGEWGLHYVTIGAHGDSFYEYLLKSWILSGYKDQESKQMSISALNSIKNRLIGKSFDGFSYLGFLKFGELEPLMDHLSCFAPGLFALASKSLKNPEYLRLAEDLIETCHKSYEISQTGLGPEVFWFTETSARASKKLESSFALRPETIESYFYLWRLTKKQKYRDWGWEIVESLEKHCRTPNGFSGIKDVYDENSEKDDIQQSYFLAETLKYLFLLFSDDSVLGLDQWVFNTEGHPLPIRRDAA
ncbi:mannosyl-oligosaccharide alpha-1,2-mannosidase IA-like [Culicoides brevitarsis]|uniref:mannosyl-oligosaccharide alpha-1,2-mannosidase IA-like n=1 Tax=Culicoides brevitarsis TaxID=469753 RepID=UPI00307B110C